jgi:hypothetical protein
MLIVFIVLWLSLAVVGQEEHARANSVRLLEVVRYGEQQVNAMVAMCHSMLLAKHMNRVFVEPGLCGSFLWQVPTASQWRSEPHSALYFGDVYNFEQVCSRLKVNCLRRASKSRLGEREQWLLQCAAAERGAHVDYAMSANETASECRRRSIQVRRFGESVCWPPWSKRRAESRMTMRGKLGSCWASLSQAVRRLGVGESVDVAVFESVHKRWVSAPNVDAHCSRAIDLFDYNERFFSLCRRYLRASGVGRYVAMQLRTQRTGQLELMGKPLAESARQLAGATVDAVLQWFASGTGDAFGEHDHIFIAADTFEATTANYGDKYKSRSIYKAMVDRLVAALAAQYGEQRVITSVQAHAGIRKLSKESAFRKDAPLLSRIIDHVLCFKAPTFLNVKAFGVGAYHQAIVDHRHHHHSLIVDL